MGVPIKHIPVSDAVSGTDSTVTTFDSLANNVALAKKVRDFVPKELDITCAQFHMHATCSPPLQHFKDFGTCPWHDATKLRPRCLLDIRWPKHGMRFPACCLPIAYDAGTCAVEEFHYQPTCGHFIEVLLLCRLTEGAIKAELTEAALPCDSKNTCLLLMYRQDGAACISFLDVRFCCCCSSCYCSCCCIKLGLLLTAFFDIVQRAVSIACTCFSAANFCLFFRLVQRCIFCLER
mmetsp:Transcript_102718/g.199091  ORF Transcript_102718/g.199091 Transcript_102718/m.199091 type:complete len:235 (+) Transcript_102718:1468-2172(+)